VTGGQFLYATRDRTDRFLSDGDRSGSRTYDIFSPKVGLLWDVTPAWQVFANISRSAEVPTFDANTFATPASTALAAQTATTYEIGTRGRRPDFTWDIALYRANLEKFFYRMDHQISDLSAAVCRAADCGASFDRLRRRPARA
jgi:iron complex outermembrane receptor protein